MTIPSYSDAPFHCPADPVVGGVILDLPFPPSANRIWRVFNGKTVISPLYEEWKRNAVQELMLRGQHKFEKITGDFEVEIALCPPPRSKGRSDVDNRIKPTIDFLQRIGVISNDKNCQRVVAYWCDQAKAPSGCRVKLRVWKG